VATGEVVGDLLAIAKATGTRAADPSLLHGHGCSNFDCLLAYAHASDAAAWRSYIGWGEAKVFPDANALVQTAPAPSHDVLVSSLTSGDGGGSRTMAGARDAIVTLALSPDGRTVAASQEDGEILVWDAPSGTKIASFLVGALNGRDFLSFAPDGKRLAWCSGGAAGRINVWLVR
jgi:WD40 repeat protein